MFNESRFRESAEAYDLATRFDPDWWIPYLGLAYALLQSDKAEEALSECQRAAHLGSDELPSLMVKGQALLKLRRLDEAVATFQAAIQAQPDCAAAHGLLGNALSALGRLDEAAKAYKASEKLRPKGSGK